jgi:hypothetical protein
MNMATVSPEIGEYVSISSGDSTIEAYYIFTDDVYPIRCGFYGVKTPDEITGWLVSNPKKDVFVEGCEHVVFSPVGNVRNCSPRRDPQRIERFVELKYELEFSAWKARDAYARQVRLKEALEYTAWTKIRDSQ